MNLEIKILLLVGGIIAGILLLGNVLPVYAQEDEAGRVIVDDTVARDADGNVLYEDPDLYPHNMTMVEDVRGQIKSAEEMGVQALEPWLFKYTINWFGSGGTGGFTKPNFEDAVERAFLFWIDDANLNVELEYVPDFFPFDPFFIYGDVVADDFCGLGLGCGGGGGPNTWCEVVNRSGTYIGAIEDPPDDNRVHYNLDTILAHEAGHCMGLGHFSGLGADKVGCMMAPNYRTSPSHCTAEIVVVQEIWADPLVCTIAPCLREETPFKDGAVIDAFFIPPAPIVQGSSVQIAFTLANLGNVQISTPVVVSNIKDGGTIFPIRFAFLLPGETKFFDYIVWDSSNAQLGTHEIWVSWSIGDDDTSNTRIKLFPEIIANPIPPPPDPIPPPPDPEPEPPKFLEIKGDPTVVDSFITYEVIVSEGLTKGPKANDSDVVSPDGTTANGGVVPTGLDNYFFTGNLISITAEFNVFAFVDGISVPVIVLPPPPTPPPIPPPDPPTPDPVNYFIDYDEVLAIEDLINVTHIIGPAPDPPHEHTILEDQIAALEAQIVALENLLLTAETSILGLETQIIQLQQVIDGLVVDNLIVLTEVLRLQDIIDQIIILVTP